VKKIDSPAVDFHHVSPQGLAGDVRRGNAESRGGGGLGHFGIEDGDLCPAGDWGF
jgi:hypothetical protein